MKQVNLIAFLGLFITGISLKTSGQQTLPEITVLAKNYKYLSSADHSAAQPVKLLRQQVAAYDIKNSEVYQDDYDTYSITFYLPSGYILAVYDSTGKVTKTAEKFKNVALPPVVTTAIATRYPNWGISNDTYMVNYKDNTQPRVIYKLVLYNGNKRLRVKLTEQGEFLD